MTESERISEWKRFYLASQPSYKANALLAVWTDDKALFPKVVNALKLDLAGLMRDMSLGI